MTNAISVLNVQAVNSVPAMKLVTAAIIAVHRENRTTTGSSAGYDLMSWVWKYARKLKLLVFLMKNMFKYIQ